MRQKWSSRKRCAALDKRKEQAVGRAAAVEQLQGVAGVVVEGLPRQELNGIYLPADDHEGWPRFESGQGNHLYRHTSGRWFLNTAFTPDGPNAFAHIVSSAGPLPVDSPTWQVFDGASWKGATLSVALLQSAEELARETERLRVTEEQRRAALARREKAAKQFAKDVEAPARAALRRREAQAKAV